MDSMGDVLYLSRTDIEKLDINMMDIIPVVEGAFLEKAKGRVEVPPKPGIHPQNDAFIHAMPAEGQSQHTGYSLTKDTGRRRG